MSRRGSLPRGSAWPLTNAEVRAGLGDEFDRVDLIWYTTARQQYVASLKWTRPDVSRTEHPVELWLEPVNDADAGWVGELLTGNVLPEVADWVRHAYLQDDEWQARGHAVWWTVSGGKLLRDSHDQSPKRTSR